MPIEKKKIRNYSLLVQFTTTSFLMKDFFLDKFNVKICVSNSTLSCILIFMHQSLTLRFGFPGFSVWITLIENRNVGVTTPYLSIWWEPPDIKSRATQRVLSQVDSWLSTSPVVCVLVQQCLYPRRQNTASGPNSTTRTLEFLQTPLILIYPVMFFPQTSKVIKD